MAIEAKCIKCGEKQANNMAVSATVVWPDKRRDNPNKAIKEANNNIPFKTLKKIRLSRPSDTKKPRTPDSRAGNGSRE